jgi:hypothetical protein
MAAEIEQGSVDTRSVKVSGDTLIGQFGKEQSGCRRLTLHL